LTTTDDTLRRELLATALAAELHNVVSLPRDFHLADLQRRGEMAAWIVQRLMRAARELEEQYGQLTVRVPVDPSGIQLAEAVRKAVSTENRPVVGRARQVAQEHFTAGAMSRRWTDYLLKVLRGSV